MPWTEMLPMDQRQHFLQAHLTGQYRMTELCAHYGISRKTGYKWIARFAANGRAGLIDQSRAPHHCPHKITPALAEQLCQARSAHPDWGPRKLRVWLVTRHPTIAWPAPSSMSELFRRTGLSRPQRRRRHYPHPGAGIARVQGPNDLWTADFKGEFKTRDARYCYPLTIADQYSRYLLTCKGFLSTAGRGVRRAFERTFATYGLPQAIRTDNGAPFAATGLHGLSRLNVWWMRLGIQHQRIRPASPQENGIHERMHRTLKQSGCQPRANCAAQQRTFNAFRTEFNHERPHQALANGTPATRYHPSPRPYSATLPPLEYPGHFLVRRISPAGTFRFRGHCLFLAHPLAEQVIGMEEIDTGIWSIYFNTVLLATLDEHDYRIRG